MPEHPPSGWFPDPFGRHELRYWDGGQWTQHVASKGRQTVDPAGQQAASAVTTAQSPANWYPDPYGRHEVRYWDGSQWTEHVASKGCQAVDPPGTRPPALTMSVTERAVQQPQRQSSTAVDARESRLFATQLLVVNQKARLFGSNVEYAVRDEDGKQIGAVQEVGRGLLMRRRDKHRGLTDQSRAYKLQVVDTSGQVLIAMTRPRDRYKSKMTVTSGNGAPIGRIVEESFGLAGGVATVVHAGLTGWFDSLDSVVEGLDGVGHARFRIESGEQVLGSIHAENLQAWDFNIQDTTGIEIARITKSWAGWAKEKFTNADNYVVQIHRPLEDPLHSLVIAAALAVDIALKQGNPGSTMVSR